MPSDGRAPAQLVRLIVAVAALALVVLYFIAGAAALAFALAAGWCHR